MCRQNVVVGIEIRRERIRVIGLGRNASAGELAALDEHGFVIVRALLSEAEVESLRREFERLVAADPESTQRELGTRRAKADNSGVFAVCWRHRVVLDAAVHTLGSTFEAGRVDLRDPSPGHGEQRHHPDHGPTPVPGITATWYLDAFTVDNGATRVLPGSHRSGVAGASEIPIPGTETPVPGEVLAVGPVGSLLLRDARLFHAGGRNSTSGPRRSAFVFYQHDIPDGLSRSAQLLLGPRSPNADQAV
jgi:ectoine hydroxylase-related dioxygenase (phytanoyl-CoA dioxygenase family)